VLVYETDDYDAVEGCLKSILKSKQYRKRKEIYQVDIDVLKEVLKGCDRLVKRAEKIKKKKEDKNQKKQKRSTKEKDDTKYNYFLYFDKSQNSNKNIDTSQNVVEI
jgi:RNA binding exosome subunit